MATALPKSSYLVQRLRRPVGEGRLASVAEAFSFGGGRRNGGLTNEAMSLLRQVFSFDYMGAAEFEFGAVPEALGRLANAKLETGQFDVDGTTVYVVCSAGAAAEVEGRMRSWLPPYSERPHLKESPHFDAAINGAEGCDVAGWLELDNGWFATIDEDMFSGVARLFGVTVPA